MKKRLFLAMIFLILLSGTFAGREKEEKYYNKPIKEIVIIEKVLNFEQDEAIKTDMPAFIVPIIFCFVAYLYVSVSRTEFKIGTVVWKPKYRKQLPRGNLA